MHCSKRNLVEKRKTFEDFYVEIDTRAGIQKENDFLIGIFQDKIKCKCDFLESVVKHHVGIL